MDLIADFLTATQHERSPVIYRKWAAIGMVSLALSRQVYTSVMEGKALYPNTNIMLVGEPGLGKTVAIGTVKDVFANFGERVACGASTTTLEAAVQRMGQYFTEQKRGVPQSYGLLNDEIGTLFKEWKPWHFQTLAKLWDTNEPEFTYDIKTGASDHLYEQYVCLLVGAQPRWLAGNLPEGAFELGLPSRFLFIYEDRGVSPGQEFEHVPGALKQIIGNLGRVSMVQGYIPFDTPAREAFRQWELRGMPPTPTDFLLKHYCTRRNMHAGKLALIVAMARHPGDKYVHLEDLEIAWSLLFEAEQRMPEALAFAGSNPYRGAELSIVEYVKREFAATKQGTHERFIRDMLAKHIPSDKVGRSVEELIAQGRLKPKNDLMQMPHRVLVPGPTQ